MVAPQKKPDDDEEDLGEPKDGEFEEIIDDPVENQSNDSGASNPKAQEYLGRKLRALEKAQKEAVSVRVLPDGRIRYYDRERPCSSPGPTRGACFVTEYNSKLKTVRTWLECYDQSGCVNRVHPKMINGNSLSVQHYPPTFKDLQTLGDCN